MARVSKVLVSIVGFSDYVAPEGDEQGPIL